jgi:hypothetical protein
MGCCCGIVGLAMPRLALVLLWIFNDWISTAIDSWVWSTLGFVFLPFTTLGYVLVYHWGNGVHGFGWVLVAGAFVLDIANYSGSGYTNRERMSGASGGTTDTVA